MAESNSDSGEKTHDPTAKRLEKAREDGNVAQSRELNILAILALFLISFTIFTKNSTYLFFKKNMGIMNHFYSADLDKHSLYKIFTNSFFEGISFSFPFIISSLFAILASSLLQTNFLFRPQALMPDITKLSPMKGLKRIFGINNIIEMMKSLIKMAIFSFILYGIAKQTLHIAPEAEKWNPLQLLTELSAWFSYATLMILFIQAIIAVFDNLWTRYHRFSKLKMSLQEIKDETKQTEGDPHIKSKQRMIRRKRARQRMMQAVKQSTVVIMNPTHYAIALEYDVLKGSAPILVAKGMNDIAFKIKETAEDSKIPVIRNPQLARNLYPLPLESEIPAEYFPAVAAVIAYVMKLKTAGSRVAQ